MEINDLAEQANGSVFARMGDTIVLATAVMSKKDREENIDFFPLSVEYEERFYAAGRIFGSRYVRREGRPAVEAILTARLIDRAIRPLFPENLKKDVQVVLTCLSWDRENDADIVAMLAASCALLISDIPWYGPIAGVRLGRKGEKIVFNPCYEEREGCDFEVTLSGVENLKDSQETLINMIETKGNEALETSVMETIEEAQGIFKKLFAFQKEIAKGFAKEKIEVREIKEEEVEKDVKEFLGERILKSISEESNKMEKTEALKEELLNYIEGKYDNQPSKVGYAEKFFRGEVKRIVHQNIIEKGIRPDGRKLEEIRKISCQTGFLPRTHGSGLFCRGMTKSLSVATLGAPGDKQVVEGMEIVGEKRFMHHYNFPPFSAGEVGMMRGPGRRDIGHGMLAEKAIEPLLPDVKNFPYTIRIVSEILSSNGSTSMASTTSSSLALMDAGVPLKRPVTGIAIGLMQEENGKQEIIADIQGPEDHYGDMDFKVAGTQKGITAVQMDVKIRGIDRKTVKDSLALAKKCRLQILEEMEKEIDKPRAKLSHYAPKIYTVQINPAKIGELIGPKGKTINEIIAETQSQIDIEESGLVFVTSENEENAQRAIEIIKGITKEIKVGETFQGKITKTLEFGAFVQLTPNQEGLIHISKLAPHRVEKVQDIVKPGDEVLAKVISIDEQGRVNLSLQKKLTK